MTDNLPFSLTGEEVSAMSTVQSKLYGQSKHMGWHDKPREIGTLLALVHSEVSEALEGARKNLMDDHLTNRKMLEVELADAIIRIFDIGGREGLDISGAIAEKHNYNWSRSDHQRENRAKEGGKTF